MAKFLGVKSDPEFIETVCEKCSFTKLKESYSQKKSTDDTGVDPTKFAFRKGRVHCPGYTNFFCKQFLRNKMLYHKLNPYHNVTSQ